MTIKQNLVPESKYSLKCPNPMTPIGLCVHNTANDASAKNEINYMVGNTSQTSFHLAVDDIEVWQGLPLDRNGWHAGDGANGEGNRKYIGIEICYSKSGGGRFTKAEENASQLIADLLRERNWGIERVKKHQDFSGKYCPHRTLDLGWDRFLNLVKTKMGGTMSELHTYLGVTTDADAKKRLKEHLGEKMVEDKIECNWGEEGDNGGYLGSGRKENRALKAQNELLSRTVTEQQDRIEELEDQILPSTPVNWEENGKTVEKTEGNIKTIINYRRAI